MRSKRVQTPLLRRRGISGLTLAFCGQLSWRWSVMNSAARCLPQKS